MYFFLLTSLLESADKVANTASVYGAFLKEVKKSAQKKMNIKPAMFDITKASHKVYNQDSNKLINEIEGDILYLDPPYNSRQYGANYHVLNTIAKYDVFTPKGITGLKDYYRSAYCRKNEVADSFEELIRNSHFQYIIVSYNNEGLLSKEEINRIMQRYGKYSVITKRYQRFKADNNREQKAESTIEFLHVLEKT
jgi:adenine-specific DNA-methyltransferase